MKKKGISPLIATVLLIGMTIIVSLIVFNFVITTIEEKTSETEIQGNILMACSQTLKLEYDDPMPCGSGTSLEVSVWNKSPLDVSDLKINILSGINSVLYDAESLNSYSKGLYEIDVASVEDVSRIILMPTIELDGIEGSCPSISFEVMELLECS